MDDDAHLAAQCHFLVDDPVGESCMIAPGSQYALFESVEPIPVEAPVQESPERRFSDYVVYVDESGDHSLTRVDRDYPVFVLALCVFHKRHYAEKIIPAIEKLKFNYFGHDSVVLHEREIRKQSGDFAFLGDLAMRVQFMQQLSSIVATSNFVLITCVVDKYSLSRSAGVDSNPYHLALGQCLAALHAFLTEKGQHRFKTHVVVECRGKKEDAELELEFRRICDGANGDGNTLPLEIVFADKKTNLAGLQLADLVARPIGLSHVRPVQPNQAFDALKPKFFCNGGRPCAGQGYENTGLMIYPPQKAKSPGVPTEAVAPTGNPQST